MVTAAASDGHPFKPPFGLGPGGSKPRTRGPADARNASGSGDLLSNGASRTRHRVREVHEVLGGERSGTERRIDSRLLERRRDRGVGPPEGRSKGLAPVLECAPNQLTEQGNVIHTRSGRGLEYQERRANPGAGVEGLRTELERPLAMRPEARPDREHPVRGGPGVREEAIGDLGLKHQGHPPERVSGAQEGGQESAGDPIRQISEENDRGRELLDDRAQIGPEYVRVPEVDGLRELRLS